MAATLPGGLLYPLLLATGTPGLGDGSDGSGEYNTSSRAEK